MEEVKVILDTDLGSDCDDAGALALLHNMERQKRAKILAVTHCATEIGGSVTVKAINEYYGRADIPVGKNMGESFLEREGCKVFTKHVMAEYLERNKMPEFEEAISLMRKALTENRNVTLVAIGAFNNIAALIKSAPDDISSLSGRELIEQSVSELYVMGGDFEDTETTEYNISCDIDSARYVVDHFPKPIVFCGFEVGKDIRTGKLLKENAEDNLVRRIYSSYSHDGLRESWDPITVYAAIKKENDFLKKSGKCQIKFDGRGRVCCSPGGKDSYLVLQRSPAELCDEIDRLIV